MADLLSDVGEFLISRNLALWVDDVSGNGTMYVGMLPDEPDLAISLFEHPGAPPYRGMGAGPVIERPRLQVLVRGERNDYYGSRTKARAITAALETIANQTVNGTFYGAIDAVGSGPELIERDDRNRPTWSANFDVERTPE